MNDFFKGSRYEKACLSKVCFDAVVMEKIVSWLKSPKDILFLFSKPGRGKTYLTAALVNYFTFKKIPCYYISEKDLIEKLGNFIHDGKNALGELDLLCENEFFILDDICSARNNRPDKSMTDWQMQILFSFVENRVNSRMPTIITSNYSPNELKKMFHDRFISRITSNDNIILEIKGPDRRTDIDEN